MATSPQRLGWVYALAALFFLAATAILTYPLSLSPASRVMDLGPDTRLFLWTLGWDWHALTNDPLGLFDANIFYPSKQALAFSEHLVGVALTAMPCQWLFGDPVLSMNAVALLSIALSGFAMFVLAKQLGLGNCAALIAGCIFAFAPPRFFRIGQLHLTTVQWIPFCLAAAHGYLRSFSRTSLVAVILCFTMQAWSSGHNALFLLFAGAIVFPLSAGVPRRNGRVSVLPSKRRLLGDAAIALVAVAVMNLPLLVPYLRLQNQHGLVRSLEETEHWAPNAESFLAAPTHAQSLLLGSAGESIMRQAKAYLFPGWVALGLSLMGVAMTTTRTRDNETNESTRHTVVDSSTPASDATTAPWWLTGLDVGICLAVVAAILISAAGGVFWPSLGIRAGGHERALGIAIGLVALRVIAARGRASKFTKALGISWRAWGRFWSQRGDKRLGGYAALAIGATWACLGPGFGLYEGLYRLVPGFDFVRVPSRLTLLSLVALAVLAGFGVEKLLASTALSNRRRATTVGFLLTVVVLFEYAAVPLGTRAFELRTSALDEWLATHTSAGPVAHVPSPDPRDEIQFARVQTTYMMYSLAHFRPIVNGYSGFVPGAQERLLRELAAFPTSSSIDALQRAHVDYVLAHRDGYRDHEWEALLTGIGLEADRLDELFAHPEGLVLRLRP